MKKLALGFVVAAAAILFTGCLPEEFIWWSPDGRTAAVRTSAGLRLADAEGQLSPVVLPGEIQSAAWLPDGTGLLVSRVLKAEDWTEAQAMIPPEEAAATMALARGLPELLKSGLIATGGAWEQFEDKFLKPLAVTLGESLEPAWFCAVHLHRDRILAALAGFTNTAALGAEIRSAQTNTLSIYELSLLPMREGRPADEPRALVRSLHSLLTPIVSPRHPVVAYRTGDGGLVAMPLEGGKPAVVAAERVAWAAWAADGRALLHVTMGESDFVGEIRISAVIGEEGRLLVGEPRAETLALMALPGGVRPRLGVLPDGRLLFASLPVTLPARVGSIQSGARFYLLDPTRPDAAPAPVEIKAGSLPEDLSTFALSPDGRFVAVAEAGTDTVAVLELATGRVRVVSGSESGWKTRLVPAWRNTRELTFAAAPPPATRPELILWQADAPARVLSRDWPDEVVKTWLEAPDGGQPAR